MHIGAMRNKPVGFYRATLTQRAQCSNYCHSLCVCQSDIDKWIFPRKTSFLWHSDRQTDRQTSYHINALASSDNLTASISTVWLSVWMDGRTDRLIDWSWYTTLTG